MTDLSAILMIIEHLETGIQYAIISRTTLFFNGHDYGYPAKKISISVEDVKKYYKVNFWNQNDLVMNHHINQLKEEIDMQNQEIDRLNTHISTFDLPLCNNCGHKTGIGSIICKNPNCNTETEL